MRVSPPRATWPVAAGALPFSAARPVGRDQHQPDAALRRREEFLRLELFAVHLRGGLHGRPGRQLVELRAAPFVRLDREHPAVAEVQLDGMVHDVVRQLTTNQPHGNAARRQIVHRPRDARHLLRIRHLKLGKKLRTAIVKAQAISVSVRTDRPIPPPAHPASPAFLPIQSLVPQFLQNFASASRAAPHAAQNRAACASGAAAAAAPRRLATSCSTCSR